MQPGGEPSEGGEIVEELPTSSTGFVPPPSSAPGDAQPAEQPRGLASPRRGAPAQAQSGRSLQTLLRRLSSLRDAAGRPRLQLSITEDGRAAEDPPPLAREGSPSWLATLRDGVLAGPPTAAAAAGAEPPAGAPAGAIASHPLLLQEAGTTVDLAPAALGGVAAAAERHRLTTTSIDIRQAARAVERSIPFVLLFVLVFLYRHMLAILTLGWLTYALYRCNRILRAEVALKSGLHPARLLRAAGGAAGLAAAVLLLQRPRIAARALVLAAGSEPISEFWDVVLAVALTDTIARLLCVLAKVATLLSSRADTPALCRRRSRRLGAVEYASQAYRSVLPAPLWYRWLARASGLGALLSTACAGTYILVKCPAVYEQLLAASAAVAAAVRDSAGPGAPPSAEELAEAGGSCPICQDAYRSPTRLPCAHIFCEDCVGEWFEREPTCPMCRAAVRPPGQQPRGDGLTPLSPCLF